MFKTVKGQLQFIAEAFMALAEAKLPVPVAERIYDAGKVVLDALIKHGELKDALIKPYLKEGENGVDPGQEGYAELLSKLNELAGQEITLALGSPLPKSAVDSISPKHFGLLKDLGWLV